MYCILYNIIYHMIYYKLYIISSTIGDGLWSIVVSANKVFIYIHKLEISFINIFYIR